MTTTWHTPTTVKTVWAQAKSLSEGTLTELLEAAREQIVIVGAAGVTLTGDDEEVIPTRVARAHWRVAQALHESSLAGNNDGSIGLEGQASPPRSADFNASIMRLLYPPRPGVG